jgi:hypothetical protein
LVICVGSAFDVPSGAVASDQLVGLRQSALRLLVQSFAADALRHGSRMNAVSARAALRDRRHNLIISIHVCVGQQTDNRSGNSSLPARTYADVLRGSVFPKTFSRPPATPIGRRFSIVLCENHSQDTCFVPGTDSTRSESGVKAGLLPEIQAFPALV